jgi:AraC-like DNA-binding protein
MPTTAAKRAACSRDSSSWATTSTRCSPRPAFSGVTYTIPTRSCRRKRVPVVERAQAPLFTELTLSLCVIRLARETGGQFRAAHVSFMHQPDDVVEYAKVLRCPIRSRASWNGVAIAKRTLDIPLKRRDPLLRSWLERQAAAILARLPAGGDACDEVRGVLSTQATAGEMTIGAVARRLSTTPRTLQRRLARGGTSFEALRDDARRQAAEQYLTTRSQPRFTVPSDAGTERHRKHFVRRRRRLSRVVDEHYDS